MGYVVSMLVYFGMKEEKDKFIQDTRHHIAEANNQDNEGKDLAVMVPAGDIVEVRGVGLYNR